MPAFLQNVAFTVLPFVLLADHKPAREELETERLRPNLLQAMKKESGQLALFA